MEMERSSKGGAGGGGGVAELELPGFRFHPTEEELLEFYLKQVVNGKKLKYDIIPTVQLYRHDPWELPAMARISGEREWYFFVPRDHHHHHRKQQPAGGGGGRPSRTTERGFWKATGSDRAVRCAADPKRLIGLKKTLVYYQGRAPRGTKTDWVMNEYRLPHATASSTAGADSSIVLCKIYRKAVSLKELEQRVAMEELARGPTTTITDDSHHNTGSPAEDSSSISSSEREPRQQQQQMEQMEMKKEAPMLLRPATLMSLPHLEVARPSSSSQPAADWMILQDPFLTQLRSPWMDNWSPYYATNSVLNF